VPTDSVLADEPDRDSVELDAVLAALADPMRRHIIVELFCRDQGEHPCASFDLPVAKSTRSHHWRVLRQAGLVHQRHVGNGSLVALRRDDIAHRFPGLLDVIAASDRASSEQGISSG